MNKVYTVIGGSGFVGRYIVQQLAEAGHRVRVAVRNPGAALFLKPLGTPGQVEPVLANIRFPGSIANALAGSDGAVNLVGILYKSGAQSFDALQAQGAATVAQAAKAAGLTSLVHVSAIGADSDSPADYARTKAEGEQAVTAAFPDATILRPSIIFGPEDGFFNRFARLARQLPVMPVICGDTRFQPVYVGDVAQAAVQALSDPKAFGGKTFELGGPTVYRFRDLQRYILDEIMCAKPMVDVPLLVAKAQAAVLGLLPKPPLTLGQLRMLERDNVVSAGANGFKAFGINPTPVEAVVPSYLVQYRPQGRFSRKTA